ncbi:MAG: acyl-CoA dehydrogenase family protein [Acidimicrobiia bacterium]
MPAASEETMETFRARALAFLEDNALRKTGADDWSTRTFHANDEEEAEHFRKSREWQRTLFDNGWAGARYPKAYGGAGLDAAQARAFNELHAQFDVATGFIGAAITLCGPPILKYGSDALKGRYLPPMLRGDEVWCQLFSEPGAGSDLAALSTRAVLQDDGTWKIDGQKVWTSSAQFADYGILLARTAPDLPKHKGITMFVTDMRAPGVEIRPLVQANGASHFNEVFLTDVVLPADAVIGEVNAGWAAARLVLANESAMIGGGRKNIAEELVSIARRRNLVEKPGVRDALVISLMRDRIGRLMTDQLQAAMRAGASTRLDGSLLKLFFAQSKVHFGQTAIAMMGPASLAVAPGDESSDDVTFAQAELINRFSISIGGGTNEVHRNGLGERVLGLPPEPRTDKDLPWKDLPK